MLGSAVWDEAEFTFNICSCLPALSLVPNLCFALQMQIISKNAEEVLIKREKQI